MSCPLQSPPPSPTPGTVHLSLPPQKDTPPPAWMRDWLWAAAVYNIVFGLWVVAFPNSYFAWLGMDLPNYPQLWQCIGMIVGVYGLGYFVAGFAPLVHWPIVLVGFLGKIFGPLGFLQAILLGSLPLSFGWILLTNDLLWWIPFGGILLAAWQRYAGESDVLPPTLTPQQVMAATTTHTGETLASITETSPTLLVCLRHFGCTFCREMVDDVLAALPSLPADTRVVFVTTGSLAQAHDFFTTLLEHTSNPTLSARLAWLSDPQRILYRVLGLHRGSFWQVLGLTVWIRGIAAGIFKGYGVGTLQGDGFQMPGLFWLVNGTVQSQWAAQSASDRVDSTVISSLLLHSANV